MAPDASDRREPLVPGWDRRDPWTLRFLDRSLEREYQAATAQPARRRLQIANLVAAPLWVSAGVAGPWLLAAPAIPFYLAGGINAGWNLFVVLLTRREMSVPAVWSIAVVSTMLGIGGVAYAFASREVFTTTGAAALMVICAFGIALVRPAAWVAALLSLLTLVVFGVQALRLDLQELGAFQVFLLAALLTGATLGARYLEEAERTAFAQGEVVAYLHRRVDRLFRQYLSPEVAQALVDEPALANLGGEVTDVTVLFADLQGFTPFSERVPAHDVVAMLNRAFGAAVPAVFAEGGTVVQFMGDALMAVFNAPIRQQDHALRACRAGLALQRAMGDDAASETPRFRVGINSGPALVGNVGSTEIHNYLAIGDTTNVAARLQGFAPPGSVVLGQPTYDLVREHVRVRPLGDTQLKGKSTPTPVFELLGIEADDTMKVSDSGSEEARSARESGPR